MVGRDAVLGRLGDRGLEGCDLHVVDANIEVFDAESLPELHAVLIGREVLGADVHHGDRRHRTWHLFGSESQGLLQVATGQSPHAACGDLPRTDVLANKLYILQL